MYIKLKTILTQFIIYSFCLFTFQLGHAQFPKTIKGLAGTTVDLRTISNSNDSGILLCGFNFTLNSGEFFKLDNNGNTLWTKQLFGNLLTPLGSLQTKDGGYIIHGATNTYDEDSDGFFCKLDPCGNLEFGYIIRTNGQNYISEIIEIDNNRLIIHQSGFDFEIDGIGASNFCIFDCNKKSFSQNYIVPLSFRLKNSDFYNNLYYYASLFYFRENRNSSQVALGSSILSYDTGLNFHKINHVSPYDFDSNLRYIPVLWSNFIFQKNSMLIGGDKNKNGKADVFEFDYDLNLLNIQYSKSTLDTNHFEQLEFISKLENNQYLFTLNKIPQNTQNLIAYFAVTDSSFKRTKEIKYGDTLNFKHGIRDQIEFYNSNQLVGMSQLSKTGEMKYHLVQFDDKFQMDTSTAPVKRYDWKCPNSIPFNSYIFDTDFDTLRLNNASQIVHFSSLPNLNRQHIIVYPNPNKGILNIQNFDNTDYSLELYDENGRLILSEMNLTSMGLFTYEFPINISNGMYFLTIKNQWSVSNHKINLIR